MKRIIALLLLALLLLSGCRSLANNEVEFFYCRDMNGVSSGVPDAVLTAETRSFTNPTDDLNYLLAIYLQGPQDPQLHTPFPAGTKLLGIRRDADTLHITLDAPFARLENLDLTLACACLTQTCIGLTDAEQVHIQAKDPDGGRSVSMTIRRDQLLLRDNTPLPPEEINETT